MQVKIRKAEEKDYPFILRVNEENVEVLSPMNEAGIQNFFHWSELFLIAEVGVQTVRNNSIRVSLQEAKVKND
ncbi:MAG: hypothetical protein IKY28_04615 [Anaerotignum sp.]|nr:hypothetical protein [Anaerotignum sp.]